MHSSSVGRGGDFVPEPVYELSEAGLPNGIRNVIRGAANNRELLMGQ